VTKKYQVVGIGNAVSDVIAKTSDEFLSENNVTKGIMQLIDETRAAALFSAMKERTETPGGSVANTISGLGSLGVSTAFIGRVADDDLGLSYASSMVAEGTDFPNDPVVNAELPTSRSMIFISPDGERSMNTYLGISSDVGPSDVSEKDPGKAAFRKAADQAQSSGARAGISLSDPFCVDRHRDDFRSLVSGSLDYFLCNEEELKSLYQTEDLTDGLTQGAADCNLVVCTRSSDGVSICQGAMRWDVPVVPITPVDATGAGDQFAAGFLYGLVQGFDPETCGKIGGIAAGEVIGHVGPRAATSIADMLKEKGI
jgi:sugar/nucleoside kinase (ribokinase family)